MLSKLNLTIEDFIKLGGILLLAGAAWARVESGLADLHSNLDKIQDTYVRKDVSTVQQDVLIEQLRQVNLRLDRIEKKLDK